MPWTKTEATLAAVLVDDLRSRGWSVYQEVEALGAVADIVATQGSCLWVIEAKVSLGVGVLSQARRWIGQANLVSCAVAPGRTSDARRFALDAAGAFGIGVLEVHRPEAAPAGERPASGEWHKRWTSYGLVSGPAIEVVRPTFTRRSGGRVRAALREEQKTYAQAGNADGKRYTAFTATCDAIRRELEFADHPLVVSELVGRLRGNHHYASEASARGAIRKWVEAGKIEGVELEHRGRPHPTRVRLVGNVSA